MLTLRKATLSDLDFLVMADLSSDDDTDFPTPMTPEERQEHRRKIAGFVQEDESKTGRVYEDSERNRPIGMILCRWRKRPPHGVEEHSGDSVFSELADSLFSADGRFCEIFQLWVDSAFRRCGLGTRLKEQVEVECRRRGIGMIYTHTEAQNLHVIALNEKLGYRQVRYGPIWDEVPRVSLVKRLDDV